MGKAPQSRTEQRSPEDHDREANTPPLPLRLPNRNHHVARLVRQRTPTRSDINSVVESWVDMRADIAAINRGEGIRHGNDYVVNGRRYRNKSEATDARTYPVDGIGVHSLTRGEYNALKLYNELGDSPRLDHIFAKMRTSTEDRARAYSIWIRIESESSDVD